MYLWRHLSTEAISIYGETRSQGVLLERAVRGLPLALPLSVFGERPLRNALGRQEEGPGKQCVTRSHTERVTKRRRCHPRSGHGSRVTVFASIRSNDEAPWSSECS